MACCGHHRGLGSPWQRGLFSALRLGLGEGSRLVYRLDVCRVCSERDTRQKYARFSLSEVDSPHSTQHSRSRTLQAFRWTPRARDQFDEI